MSCYKWLDGFKCSRNLIANCNEGLKCFSNLARLVQEIKLLQKSRREKYEDFKCFGSLVANSTKVLNALEVSLRKVRRI